MTATKVSEEQGEKKKKLSIMDVLRSETKFRIYGLLRIYPELSLAEIASEVNRSKSTIHEHVQKMLDSGLIEVSREEEVRSNIPRKYYKLCKPTNNNQEEEERCENLDLKNCSQLEKKKYIQDSMSMMKSFTAQQFTILKKWMKFLDIIEEKFSEEKYDEILNTFRSLRDPENVDWYDADDCKDSMNGYSKLFTVEFYSPQYAQTFRRKAIELHNQLEMDEKKEMAKNDSPVVRPIYGAITLLPMKFIIETIQAYKREKKEEKKEKRRMQKMEMKS